MHVAKELTEQEHMAEKLTDQVNVAQELIEYDHEAKRWIISRMLWTLVVRWCGGMVDPKERAVLSGRFLLQAEIRRVFSLLAPSSTSS